MNNRNLEIVRQIIWEGTGLDVTYAYDDLVFPDHTAFIIQFDELTPNGLFCYFHQDCNPEEQQAILSRLTENSMKKKYLLAYKGTYQLEQKEGEVEIKFNKIASGYFKN